MNILNGKVILPPFHCISLDKGSQIDNTCFLLVQRQRFCYHIHNMERYPQHPPELGPKLHQSVEVELERCFNDTSHSEQVQNQETNRSHHIEALKQSLYRTSVTAPENIPKSYWNSQHRIARERGHEDIEITDELRRQQTEVVLADQKSSLNTWVDYLASPDAVYPAWLKSWAVRNMVLLEPYDKQEKIFRKRDKNKKGEPSDVKPFPDLDREALAYVLDAVNKKYSAELLAVREYKEELGKQKKKAGQKIGKQISTGEIDRAEVDPSSSVDVEDIKLRIAHLRAYEQEQMTQNIATASDISIEDFVKRLDSNDFAKLYAFAIEQCTPASKELLVNTKGKWVKYDRGSNHMPLVQSLQSHGTGWCTAGESTAQTQLQAGDFYVYYSHDAKGKPTIPRAAIRMQEGTISPRCAAWRKVKI